METRRKKVFKPLSVVKEFFQAFDLLVHKVVKFTEAFKYAITSLPLAVAILNSTLYQPGIGRLRNINLSRSSSHKYPSEYSRDVKWVVDGFVAICSLCPCATYNIYCASYEEWFKTHKTFITPLEEA